MALEYYGHVHSKNKDAKSEVNILKNRKVQSVSRKHYSVSGVERIKLVAAASFQV